MQTFKNPNSYQNGFTEEMTCETTITRDVRINLTNRKVIFVKELLEFFYKH